jgi:phage tail sheath protein FI
MAPNDLDDGRMICLNGVAPSYPAEFVIFRIGGEPPTPSSYPG